MLTALWATTLLTIVATASNGGAGCSDSGLVSGGCGTTNTGTTLTVTGERNTPGSGSPSHPGSTPDANIGTWIPPKEFSFDDCLANWNNYIRCFRATEEADEADPAAPAAPALPAITMTDLEVFAPAPVTAVAEPGNVGIAGMPTNFVAAASAHARTGTLFGLPISVRFTPVGYDFDYGDGDQASLTTGGETWSSLGQAQFTPTSTSHVYQERGTYLADVDVRYSAEIDLGIGWIPLSGELTTDGPDQQIRIFEAHTALVAFTCEQKPTAPGC
jgi:hypothetical protein